MSLNRDKIYNNIKTASFTRESLLVNRPYGFLLPLTTPFNEFRVILVRFSFLNVDWLKIIFSTKKVVRVIFIVLDGFPPLSLNI